MLRTSLFAALTAALLLVATSQSAPAANAKYDSTLKGVSETFDGHKFPYSGSGTMTIDDVTGTLTYSYLLSNGLTFAGSGNAAITAKGRIFGSVTTSSGGIYGAAVVEGKASKDRTHRSINSQ